VTVYRSREVALTFIGDAGRHTALLAPGWHACPACAQLVDAGDRRGLLRRALRSFGRRDRLATLTLRGVQAAFWDSRRGGAP
jgi:hypothetical protein